MEVVWVAAKIGRSKTQTNLLSPHSYGCCDCFKADGSLVCIGLISPPCFSMKKARRSYMVGIIGCWNKWQSQSVSWRWRDQASQNVETTYALTPHSSVVKLTKRSPPIHQSKVVVSADWTKTNLKEPCRIRKKTKSWRSQIHMKLIHGQIMIKVENIPWNISVWNFKFDEK